MAFLNQPFVDSGVKSGYTATGFSLGPLCLLFLGTFLQ
jgi:hypothetical protein